METDAQKVKAHGDAIRHGSERAGVRRAQCRITMNPAFSYAIKDRRAAREAGSGRMRTLRFLQFFFRRIFMSFPKKRRRAKVDGDESFLAVLRHFKAFGQLD